MNATYRLVRGWTDLESVDVQRSPFPFFLPAALFCSTVAVPDARRTLERFDRVELLVAGTQPRTVTLTEVATAVARVARLAELYTVQAEQVLPLGSLYRVADALNGIYPGYPADMARSVLWHVRDDVVAVMDGLADLRRVVHLDEDPGYSNGLPVIGPDATP